MPERPLDAPYKLLIHSNRCTFNAAAVRRPPATAVDARNANLEVPYLLVPVLTLAPHMLQIASCADLGASRTKKSFTSLIWSLACRRCHRPSVSSCLSTGMLLLSLHCWSRDSTSILAVVATAETPQYVKTQMCKCLRLLRP